jgi:glycosyltransferase involved in cell wall biosynthesis
VGKSKKLNILHLLSQRPDSTGSGIYLQAMLREAKACGHNNFLVAGIQSHMPADLDCIDPHRCLFVKFLDADISYSIVGMSDVMPYESKKFCDLSSDDLSEYEKSFSTTFKDAVRMFKPDVIHSHHLWLISSVARRLFPDIPMLTTCHGSDLRQFQNCPHLQNRVTRGCRQLDAVMALSETQKKDIVSMYRLPSEKVFVVGAGYNDSLFFQKPKPQPDPVQLIYAGKLSRAKGVPWLLRSLSAIDDPAWQLHLVGGGSGADKEECLMLAKNLGNRVTVHGTLTQQGLADIMGQCHIFMLPSFYEGLPLVVLEALASGCRIIATDLPGVMEIIGEMQMDFINLIKTPRLFNTDQPFDEDKKPFEKALSRALRRQIKAACRQPQIDLSAIQDKMTSFSWRGVFGKVESIYYRVTDQLHSDQN